MDLTFQVLLFIPFVVCIAVALLFRSTIVWQEALAMFVITCLTVSMIYLGGKHSQISDSKIQVGEIFSKERVNDSHQESYSCNCHTTCSGYGKRRSCSRHCSTCWRTRYTVDWYAMTSFGRHTVDSDNSLYSSVWRQPDPARYNEIKNGDPFNRTLSFSNYVKAVPDSILHINPMNSVHQSSIPAYPQVYDQYKTEHVLTVGQVPINVGEWNLAIQDILKKISPKNCMNIIVIFTDIQDKGFQYSVENAWRTGKINDTLIFIGVEGDKITWSGVSGWMHNESNEDYIVALKNELFDVKTIDISQITSIIAKHVTNFKQPNEEKFEYLKSAIEPPTWVLVLSCIFELVALCGLGYFFHKNDFTSNDNNY